MRTASRLPAEQSTSGGPLNRLEREHRAVEAIFAQASLERGPARGELVAGLVAALTEHAAFEDEHVYPVVADVLGPSYAARARGDHDQMRELIDDLERAENDPEFSDALRRLHLVVQAHVADEEGVLFPALVAAAPDAPGTPLAPAPADVLGAEPEAD